MSYSNTIFNQLLSLVPRHEFENLAKEHDIGMCYSHKLNAANHLARPAFTIMSNAAMSVVTAKSVFKYFGFVLRAILPPNTPPNIVTIAIGIAQAGLKLPCKACPRKPANAVAATIADAVPTAIRMGTPHANTISGTRNDPPETPTIPEKKPVVIAKGTASHKFMT